MESCQVSGMSMQCIARCNSNYMIVLQSQFPCYKCIFLYPIQGLQYMTQYVHKYSTPVRINFLPIMTTATPSTYL